MGCGGGEGGVQLHYVLKFQKRAPIFFSCCFEPVQAKGVTSLTESLVIFYVKVTVQFETEGNGQNEIVSHMHRPEVKL